MVSFKRINGRLRNSTTGLLSNYILRTSDLSNSTHVVLTFPDMVDSPSTLIYFDVYVFTYTEEKKKCVTNVCTSLQNIFNKKPVDQEIPASEGTFWVLHSSGL